MVDCCSVAGCSAENRVIAIAVQNIAFGNGASPTN